jgi:RHS repeat-associated protein
MFRSLPSKPVLASFAVCSLVVGVAAALAPAAVAAGHRPLPPRAQQSSAAKWRTNASSGKPTTTVRVGSKAYAVAKGGEIPALRTQKSDTYVDGGRLRTVMSTAIVNYHTPSGAWAPVDTTLTKSADGSLANTADQMKVSLPATSLGTVAASDGAAIINTTMVGATSVPVESSKSTATYSNVYTGVTATFTVRAESVDETLRLASPQVPAAFVSLVTVATGSSLRLEQDRSVSVVAGDGTVQGSLPAPVMTDSSGDLDHETSTGVAYTISGSAPKYTVTTTPSQAWLRDPARVFPVLLDPSFTFGAGLDLGCYVTNPGTGSPSDPVLCSANTGTDNRLLYGSTAYVRRAFVKFGDLTGTSSPVPADAFIDSTDIVMTEAAQSSTAAMDTELQRPTTAWTSGITWAGQPATSGTQFDRLSITPPGVGNTVTFHPVTLIQATVRGGSPNYGFELRLVSEAVSNTIQFYGFASPASAPTMTVTWEPNAGQQKFIGAYDHQLSDRADVHVDLADRNLVVNGTDESLSGPGQSLIERRTYNSAVAAVNGDGSFGRGWSLNGGVDTGITISRAQVTVTRAGGSKGGFRRNFAQSSLTVRMKDNDPDGVSWANPAGWKADLTKIDSTHYKLAWRQSHVEWTYTMPTTTSTTAWLSKVDDGNGNVIIYTSTGSPLHTTQAADTTAQRSVNFTYDPTTGNIAGGSESLAAGATGARSWSYTYDANGNLSTYTDPAGQVTRYCYNGANLMSKIITARGSATGASCATTQGTDVTDITYDTGGQVASLSYENGVATAITVQFTTTIPLNPGGTSGETTFTDPYGKTTEYTYDTSDRITKTVTPLGYTATSTFNTNNDVTASVTPTNYSGGGSDPTSTTHFTGDNPDTVTSPTGASVAATYGGSESNQPDQVSDDRDPAHDPAGTSASSYLYNDGGQITANTKATATIRIRHEGDSGYTLHCGPGATPTAAYKGAVCETRDANFDAANPAQHRTAYRYNALGEQTSMTTAQPAGTARPAWTYTYDGLSRVTKVTDARGKATIFTYDTMDRLTRATYNDLHYTAYTWDADGNRLTVQDYTAGGTAITNAGDTYTYDNLNRTATETPDGQPATTTSWDANSRMLAADDGSGAGPVSYGYNDDGALTSMVESGGSCAGYSLSILPPASSLCILFDVDKNGRRLRTVQPGDFAEQDQTYNSGGQLINVTGTGQNAGAGITLYAFTYSYLSGTNPTNHTYKRTNNGSTAVLGVGAGSSLNYAYDTQARLSSATTKNSSGTITAKDSYCYDANGNRTSTSTTIGASCPGSSTYTFDGANQTTGTSNAYDSDGDETSAATSLPAPSTVRASTWTDSQQLATVTLNGGTALNNTYYDAGNNQLLTADSSASQQDQLTTTNTGAQTVTHTTAGNPSGGYYTERDPAGTLIALRDATTGNERYPLTDNLGSVWAVVDNTGTAVDAYTYDAYGQRTTVLNNYPQGFGYTAAYTNPGTGLVLLGARYYDPTRGRFTQTDPAQATGDYGYAGEDPTNQVDPTGLSFLSLGGSINLGFGHVSVGVNIGDGGFHPFIGAGLGPKASAPVTPIASLNSGSSGSGNSLSAQGCAYGACYSHSLTGSDSNYSYNFFGGTSASVNDTYTF